MPTMALGQSIRSFDKVLEESQLTGELRLGGRALKELPSIAAKYSVRDILVADISKNRLLEIPSELIEHGQSIEELDVYHNSVRNIPDSIHKLRSLTYLNLSRNQLTYLPPALCALPLLEVLIVAYNKLVSLPEEIGQLSRLTELDVRSNEICQLPVTLNRLETMVSLSLRRNSLQRLPEDIHGLLSLRVLDIAENQVTSLPLQMRLMTSLEQLDVTCNPLVFPPAHVCARGRQHIYKFLEMRAVRGEQEERLRRGAADELEQRPARPPPVGGNDAPPPSARSSVAGGGEPPLLAHRAAPPPPQHHQQQPPPSYPGYETSRDSGHVQLRRFEPARSASGLQHTSRAYSHLPAAGPPSVGATSSYSSPGGHHAALTPAEQERARRDRESIDRLRQNIEGRLHVSLPDDLRSALGDGVVLCHLANHVRPRAVSSIHVPSPAVEFKAMVLSRETQNPQLVVPKLNEAKCRRNLQNFLEACRRIGVEEEYLCAPTDVHQRQNLVRVSVTVERLLRCASGQLQSAV